MSYGSHPVIKILMSISIFLWWFFLYILLLTLITRLYVTFLGSALEITTYTIYIFAFILACLFVLNIVIGIGYILFIYDNDGIGWTIYLCSGYPGLFLYIVGSALSVRLYVKNLSVVAHKQMSSHRDLTPRAEDLLLNSRQMRLLNLSAKYILLFFIAILSTNLSTACIILVSWESRGSFTAIDFTINLLCLYLQFAFAADDYKKCCGSLDSYCRTVVSNRMKRIMHKESLEMRMRIEHVLHVKETDSVEDMDGTTEI